MEHAPSQKFAIRLSYLGKNYCGWQKQNKDPEKAPKLPSIQETIEAAVSKMCSEPIRIIGSGRTDAGVNAVGQVAHFRVHDFKFDSNIIKRGLNSLLPEDIRVMEARVVKEEFHAQQSAIKKQYSYFFQQGPAPLPHLMANTWWIQKALNVEAMHSAIQVLLGEHDFKSFQASGADLAKSTVRTILEAEVSRLPLPDYPGCDLNEIGFSMVRIRLVGTGFLKQMVRGIAGTLLQMGENYRNSSEMADILVSKDRKKVGPTAPSKGLTLERVWYKPDVYGNTN